MSAFSPEVEAIIEKRRAEVAAVHEQQRLAFIERANALMTEFNFPPVEITTERITEETEGLVCSMPPGTPLAGYVCKWCEKTRFALRWTDDTLRKLAERQACFSCNHWLECIETRGHYARVIVDGRHYMYDTRQPFVEKPVGFMGFGGKVFHIKFLDSDMVMKVNNLWTQGKIPEHFRKSLPDNATFIEVLEKKLEIADASK